jgi:hypothetical protein
MDESEWLGERCDFTALPDGTKYEERVCPGYLVAQPIVAEIVTAHRAFATGNWAAMYPDADAALCEGVELFAGVIDAYQAFLMRESKEKAERERVHHGRR